MSDKDAREETNDQVFGTCEVGTGKKHFHQHNERPDCVRWLPSCSECNSPARRYRYCVLNEPSENKNVIFTAENSHACTNSFHDREPIIAESQRTQAPSEQLAELVGKALCAFTLVPGEKLKDPGDHALIDGILKLQQRAWNAEAKLAAGTQAQAAQWISTKERLPELSKFVPVIIGGCIQHTMARLDGDSWDWPYDADCAPLYVVTHWLDFLPVAPVAALEGK